VQMPAGVPVGTLAIGRAGAINAAILASSIVALEDGEVRDPAPADVLDVNQSRHRRGLRPHLPEVLGLGLGAAVS
jgi:phosphoribosylcarboxyaminoimidazole (NCAIR) mutase